MHLHSRFKAFHFQTWIEANQHLLKPPVGNKLVFQNTGMVPKECRKHAVRCAESAVAARTPQLRAKFLELSKV